MYFDFSQPFGGGFGFNTGGGFGGTGTIDTSEPNSGSFWSDLSAGDLLTSVTDVLTSWLGSNQVEGQVGGVDYSFGSGSRGLPGWVPIAALIVAVVVVVFLLRR